ncbi:MAG: hypothetical protein IJ086_00055 [Clostridium sp.]|nr:hypothetical protein [Clostridium sp.]
MDYNYENLIHYLKDDRVSFKNDDLNLYKEPCPCGCGSIYKIKKYGLAKFRGRYSMVHNDDEIYKIKCKFCDKHYFDIVQVLALMKDIHTKEQNLVAYEKDSEFQDYQKELEISRELKKEIYKSAKNKMDKFSISELPFYELNKHQWAKYFVENKLTDLNEKDCFLQIFKGKDKNGLDIFLNKVGMSLEEYHIAWRAKSLFKKDDKLQILKDEISEKKAILLSKAYIIEHILNVENKNNEIEHLINMLRNFTEDTEEYTKYKIEFSKIISEKYKEKTISNYKQSLNCTYEEWKNYGVEMEWFDDKNVDRDIEEDIYESFHFLLGSNIFNAILYVLDFISEYPKKIPKTNVERKKFIYKYFSDIKKYHDLMNKDLEDYINDILYMLYDNEDYE